MSGSFGDKNLLMTLPSWGPEFSVSFQFSINSHCVQLTCTIITFSSSASDTTISQGDKIPAVYVGINQKMYVLVAKDSGFAVSKQVQILRLGFNVFRRDYFRRLN